MQRVAREQKLEVMRPELQTKAHVYYKNLWRYTKCFIAGTISAEIDGVVDCVAGASLRLLKNAACVAETATDNYGDFRFDRLDEDFGPYTIEIAAVGHATRNVSATLGESINLGDIRL